MVARVVMKVTTVGVTMTRQMVAAKSSRAMDNDGGGDGGLMVLSHGKSTKN